LRPEISERANGEHDATNDVRGVGVVSDVDQRGGVRADSTTGCTERVADGAVDGTTDATDVGTIDDRPVGTSTADAITADR
jgi:hypothetical protein